MSRKKAATGEKNRPSARRGRLLFRADPRQYEVEVQARGYALP